MVLDDIRCAGTEAGLHLCRNAGWGNHNCDRESQVAGVTCQVDEPVVDAGKWFQNFFKNQLTKIFSNIDVAKGKHGLNEQTVHSDCT